MIPAAYFVSKDLVCLITLIITKLSLKYGNADDSSLAFATYSVLEGSVLGSYTPGHAYGEASLRLCENAKAKALFAKVGHVIGGYNSHWKRHAKTGIAISMDAYKRSLEYGDLVYSACNSILISMLTFQTGASLNYVLADAQQFANHCSQIKIKYHYDTHIAVRQAIFNLQGLTCSSSSFTDDLYIEDEHVTEMLTQSVKVPLYNYYVVKLYSLFIHNEYSAALAIAESSRNIFDFHLGMLTVADHCFFHALSAAALYRSASLFNKIRYARILRRSRRRMSRWADNCPENFHHKALLIEAEMCRIGNNNDQAASFYEQAIKSARENGYLHMEAIAHELAAQFHLERGVERVAGLYLNEARRCYAAWGATGKVRQLEKDYAVILGISTVQTLLPKEDTLSFNQAELERLDVVLASQAISSSISLDALIKNLMRIVIRHAGATRGLLLMEHTGTMHILAEGKETTEEVKVNRNCMADESACFPASIALLSRRTGETVVLANASTDERFAHDHYLEAYTSLSVICIPLLHQGRRTCMLYLENDLMADAFTADRVSLMNLLSSQIAISLENALLQKEKDDIVRIVHDSLSADIYNIFLLSEDGGCDDVSVERNCKMKLISETAGKGLQTIRDFLFLSSKESIVVVDLVDMVRDYAFKLFTESETELEINDPIGLENQALSYAIAFSLFLVCKEALANIRKHAKAGLVCFSVELKENSFHLELSDDGIGFDPDALAGPGKGLGNIRTRALEMGAILNLTSDPGMGTTFQLKLPLSENMHDVTAE
jgi:signal transduction histidine kinase